MSEVVGAAWHVWDPAEKPRTQRNRVKSQPSQWLFPLTNKDQAAESNYATNIF